MQLEDRTIIDMSIDLEVFFQVTIPKIIDTGFPEWLIESILVTPVEKLPRQREFLMSEFGMPKNFKTPFLPVDKTVPLIKKELQDSKNLLKETIQQFLKIINEPTFKTKLHPVFGEIDKQQWLTFQYKHFSHHFMQFGLL